MRLSILVVLSVGLNGVSGFVARPQLQTSFSSALFSSKDDGDVKQNQQQALAIGTLVEFEEKSRVHIGTIKDSEHKANGGARYKIEDIEGKSYDIADKAVTFSTPAPTNANKANKLLTELASAQDASEDKLCEMLDVSAELLEIAWEEAAAEESTIPDHELTPKSFVQLVHSHAATATEEYMAWRLLKMDTAHVFFKDIKHNGRVSSFKAKARKAVDNAKTAFCSSHEDAEFCIV